MTARRILTAREQHQMLSPWRLAIARSRFIGININDEAQDYTGQILRGEKTVETRNRHSLKAAVGQRVGIIRTYKGQPSMLVGYATVGDPVHYPDAHSFDADYDRHLVSDTSPHHISESPTGAKFGYPLHDVVHEPQPYAVNSIGIPWRWVEGRPK